MFLSKPRVVLALALALTSAAPALAAGINGVESLQRISNARPSQPTQQEALWVSARVERLNVPAHKITISHQAIAKAGMPSMTMTFQVADNAQLALLQQGDPVDIQIGNRNGATELVDFRVLGGLANEPARGFDTPYPRRH